MAGRGASDKWLNDSGADTHSCGNIEWFQEYTEHVGQVWSKVASNSFMCSSGVGAVKVKALVDSKGKDILLTNVEYVPGCANLFSENVLLKKGFKVTKEGTQPIAYYKDGKQYLEARCENGLQVMRFIPYVNHAMTALQRVPEWHERLGHICWDFIKKTAEKGDAYGLEDMKMSDSGRCETCIKAKSIKLSY